MKTKVTPTAEKIMSDVIHNTEEQLIAMVQAQKDKDVTLFLWAQYKLWNGYHELRAEVVKA